MKKFALFCTGLVLVLLCNFTPLSSANAADTTSLQKVSHETSFPHETDDYIPVKAIAVDDTFKPNIKTSSISKFRMSNHPSKNFPGKDTNFYQNWGKTQLALSDDGTDKAELYDMLATSFTDNSNVTASKATYKKYTFYIMYEVSLNTVTLTSEDVANVYSIFRDEHPEYYWLDFGILYDPGTTGYVKNLYIITTSDYDTPQERTVVDSKINNKIDEYRASISGLTTNNAIAQKIHDKMINDIDYLYENDEPSESLYAHNIVGILDGTGGVCEGYAKAYQYLLNLFDIPNIYVVGLGGSGYDLGGHAWNLVMADNERFYDVDVTWDDRAAKGISYDYFMNGSTAFDLEHIPSLPDGSSIYYLYPLPSVPALNYKITDNTAPNSISNKEVSLSSSTFVYNGTQFMPSVSISGLKKDVDFKVFYFNNISSGTATVAVVGNGTYTGVTTNNFTINKAAFPNVIVSSSINTYNGKSYSLPLFAPSGSTITYCTNSVTYSSEIPTYAEVGKYKVYYKVSNRNCTGIVSGSATITINPRPISDMIIALSSTSYTYSGKANVPAVIITGLSEGNDYKVAYRNNVNSGLATITITGIGNYTGSTNKTFVIKKASISGIKATGVSIAYDELLHSIKVVAPKGAVITFSKNKKDYTLTNPTYKASGVYKVYYRVHLPNYNDVNGYATINITKKSLPSLSVKLSSKNLTYNGSALAPKITIKNGSRTLVKGKDFNLKFKNNINPGTATVSIIGIGNYTGKISKTYTIKIGVPTFVVTSSSKAATISWHKVPNVTGYEVYMSTSLYGEYSLVKSEGSKTTKYTQTNLSENKVYYFKLRAYKTINDKRVYGEYSWIKLIKTK